MDNLLIGTVGSQGLINGAFDRRRALLERVHGSAIDHVFVADHISFHTGLGMDGIVNAATISGMAPDIKVFIGVYLLALRHPVTVARQLASLSESAPGRIIFGVGIGGEDRHEMEICGVDPARRGLQTNHALKALRGLLSGEAFSYDCEFFSFDDALILPAPVPEIPLIVGGRSDAAIRRTALYGDGWLGIWCTPARYGDVLDEVSQIAADSDRIAPEWLHGIQLWAGVGETRAQARDYVARGMEAMYRLPFEKFERYSPYGSPIEVADALMPYAEQGCRLFNIALRTSSDEACIDAMAEISERMKQAFPTVELNPEKSAG